MKRLYKSGAERIRPGVYKLRRELELIGRNKEREFRVIRCKLGAVFSSGQDRSEMGRLRSCGIEIAIKKRA